MSITFEKIFSSIIDYNKDSLLREFEGILGIPDFLLYNNKNSLKVFTYELKLSNWKRALVQAFRYKSYSHRSYVILDDAFVHRATKHIEKFEKAGVGLASLSVLGKFRILFEPKEEKPYCDFYFKKLEKKISKLNVDNTIQA